MSSDRKEFHRSCMNAVGKNGVVEAVELVYLCDGAKHFLATYYSKKVGSQLVEALNSTSVDVGSCDGSCKKVPAQQA